MYPLSSCTIEGKMFVSLSPKYWSLVCKTGLRKPSQMGSPSLSCPSVWSCNKKSVSLTSPFPSYLFLLFFSPSSLPSFIFLPQLFYFCCLVLHYSHLSRITVISVLVWIDFSTKANVPQWRWAKFDLQGWIEERNDVGDITVVLITQPFWWN